MNREPGDKRTGTFTSGIVSTKGQRKIALYSCKPGVVDALELSRATATGWRMMNLVWPKRIDSGHDKVTFRNGGEMGLLKGKIG
jgi:hypothetical protein